jgi:hypothetical protein
MMWAASGIRRRAYVLKRKPARNFYLLSTLHCAIEVISCVPYDRSLPLAESASMSCFISSSPITNSVKPQLEHTTSGGNTNTGDLRKSLKSGKWMQISAGNVF